MNCDQIQANLSAYHDGELDQDSRQAISLHLAGCQDCASLLAEFESYTNLFQQIPKPEAPLATWQALSAEFERQQVTLAPATSDDSESRRRSWHAIGRLALAASLLVVVGFGIWLSRPSANHAHHGDEFAMTMDHYFKTLSVNPDQAEQFLLSKYDGKTVAPTDAIKLVGFQPAVASGLPSEYTLASTSVITMPCCTCVKSVCKRQDGSTLVLFEHDDDDTQWFGKRPARMATCGDQECCLVDLNESIAATWKRGSRWMTAVGARDSDEVGKLVDWLEETVRPEPNSSENI